MWLGDRRGNLIDWGSQLWVRASGTKIDPAEHPWLAGPVGATSGIGPDYFDRLAVTGNFAVSRRRTGVGLLPSFAALRGPTFDPAAVAPQVVAFYEKTADYDINVWAEWNGLVRPFGLLVAALFSRRLGQLNLPLSALDASCGMTSDVMHLTTPDGRDVRACAWVRTFVKTGRVAYVGSYSVTTPPGAGTPCVKTVFPLSNGNAVVLLRPEALPDGSLALVSEGRRFGEPGFYLAVRHPGERIVARYVRSFRERVHVYPAENGVVRADHTMSLWGCRCVHLHYRLRRASGDTRRGAGSEGIDPSRPVAEPHLQG